MKHLPFLISAILGLALAQDSTTSSSSSSSSTTSTTTSTPTATSTSNDELASATACAASKLPPSDDSSASCYRSDFPGAALSACGNPLRGKLSTTYYYPSQSSVDQGLTTELVWAGSSDTDSNMTFPWTWARDCSLQLVSDKIHPPSGIIYTAETLSTDSFITLVQADKVCALQIKASPPDGGEVREGNGDKGFRMGDVDVENILKGAMGMLLGFGSPSFGPSGAMPCLPSSMPGENNETTTSYDFGGEKTWVKWRVVPLNGDGMVYKDVHE